MRKLIALLTAFVIGGISVAAVSGSQAVNAALSTNSKRTGKKRIGQPGSRSNLGN
jgi:hypothetical protein